MSYAVIRKAFCRPAAQFNVILPEAAIAAAWDIANGKVVPRLPETARERKAADTPNGSCRGKNGCVQFWRRACKRNRIAVFAGRLI